MIGQPIADLEKVTEVPSGSAYIANMGDGSGTKTVPQEILTKEVGRALKVGDLSELQTENKNNLVAAINEAAQSGGGGSAVDILDTKEEIEANTETGKAAGALAVQEMFGALNDNLKGFTPVLDESTGKITGYKTTIGGADTVFPFSGNRIYIEKVSVTGPNGYGGSAYLYFNVTDYKKLKIKSLYNNSAANGHAGGGSNTSVNVYNCDNNDYLNPKQIYSYDKIITGGEELPLQCDMDISGYDYIKIVVSSITYSGAEGGIKGLEIT